MPLLLFWREGNTLLYEETYYGKEDQNEGKVYEDRGHVG